MPKPDLEPIWRFHLRRGASPDPIAGACLLDAVSWFEYGRLGDSPDCVCPVVAFFGRLANDALDDADRQALRPFIPRLPGTSDNTLMPLRTQALARHLLRHDQASPILAWCSEDRGGAVKPELEFVRAVSQVVDRVAHRERCFPALAHDLWTRLGVHHPAPPRLVDVVVSGLDALLAVGPQPAPPDPARLPAAVASFARAARKPLPALS